MRYWLIGLAFACLCLPAAADEFKFKYGNAEVDFLVWTPAAPEFDYASLVPPPERIKELEATGALFAELLDSTEAHVAPNGTIETRSVEVRYFLSRAGAQQHGNISAWVDSAFDTLSIEQAYTLTADGRRLPVLPEAIDIRPDAEDDIFDDNFEVILPYPGVEAGAIAVIVTKSVEDTAALPIPWSRTYRPQWFVPVEKYDLRSHGMPAAKRPPGSPTSTNASPARMPSSAIWKNFPPFRAARMSPIRMSRRRSSSRPRHRGRRLPVK